MTTGVSVLGVGAASAIGEHAAGTMAAARAGIAGFREHPYMISGSGEPYILAWAPFVDPELQGPDRWPALAVAAAREALEPIPRLKLSAQTVRIFVGLPENRPGVPPDAAAQFGARLGSELGGSLQVAVEPLPSGHSAGLLAIERALTYLQTGKEPFCLVGGVDSYVEADTLDWVEASDRLHTDDNPYGFVPGEAAGFLLLAGPDLSRRHRQAVLAEILSAASAEEKNRIATDSVCTGQGLTEAFRLALRAVPGTVDEVICDANGEPYRADEYGFVVARLGQRLARAADYVAPADCWGDVGAASGPLFVARACVAARKEYSRGPLSLIWASSDGGRRGVAVLRTFGPEGVSV